ncbi:MAG: hypothetical protein ACYS17_14735, partial [Planctomycetota bacterium]
MSVRKMKRRIVSGVLVFSSVFCYADYLIKPGTSSQCFYYTLPVVDGFYWSPLETIAGLRFKSTGGLEIKGG